MSQLSDSTRKEIAKTLRKAQEKKRPCSKLTEAYPDLTLKDAYAIQEINIEKRLDASAHRVIGHKVGLTSHAIQSWLGVDQPDFGHLLDTMAVGDGALAPTERLLQPRIEGEIAFVLERRLKGPGVTTADVLQATAFVLPALEIIDSRIAEWNIGYFDTIADNASSSLFVLGTQATRPLGINFRTLGMKMAKNGAQVSFGAGAACLDNPVNAVAWLANTLGKLGRSLEPGHVILSGALGPVTPVNAGDHIELDIAHLGGCSVRF